jgi:hypothetical protein
MNDKENDVEIIPKKLSFTSVTSDGRSRTSSILDLHTSLSSVLPVVTIDQVDDDDDDDLPLFTNRQVYKNLAILSISFVLIYIAFLGIVSLQSTMNAKGNVGINSLIIINAFILVRTYLILNNNKKRIFFLVWFTFSYWYLHGYLWTEMDYQYQCNCLYSLCLCESSTYSNTDVQQFVVI